MKKGLFAKWRDWFITGTVVVLPAVITFALLKWLVGTVSSLTDLLLFFLPHKWTHADQGNGPMQWYWSLAALLLAVVLLTVIGVFARYYIGQQIIEWMDEMLLRVPLLNKIYGTIKQVNAAFSSGNKTSFKTVVRVEFPSAGSYAVGFVTNDENQLLASPENAERMISVFVPTTPNPTSGFLIVVPESKVTRLDMSVAEGIKYIVSLGAIAPESVQPVRQRSGESG